MALTVTDGTTTLYPDQLTTYSTTRASTTTAHQIIGRTSGIPDLTLGAVGTRTGTLTYLVSGLPDALALEAMHTEQATITFSQDDIPGMGFSYVLSGNLDVELLEPATQYYQVSVDFLETA